MTNPFNDLLVTAQHWADNPTYDQIIALGQAIHTGATPDKADDIINDVLSLYSALSDFTLPSADVFFIATAYAYYTNDSLITMTQLAQGLAFALANKTDYFDLSPDMPKPLVKHSVYAGNWVKTKRVRVYIDPAEPNSRRANRVLYGDVIEALGNPDEDDQ